MDDLRELLQITKELIDLPPTEINTDTACEICYEEFDQEGGKREAKALECCRKNICSSCLSGMRETETRNRGRGVQKPIGCPYCRTDIPLQLPKDERVVEALSQKAALAAADELVEEEEVICLMCAKGSLVPNHCLVCLSCSWELGRQCMAWKDEEEWAELRKGTLCVLCAVKHSQWHRNVRGERNEMRPLSRIVGYTRAQVEKESGWLRSRLRDDGYLPHSLCILYSLKRSLLRVEKERTSMDFLHHAREIVYEMQCLMLRCLGTAGERGDRQIEGDVIEFVCGFSKDVQLWTYHVLCSPKGQTPGEGEWTRAVGHLIEEVVRFALAICPRLRPSLWKSFEQMAIQLLPDMTDRWPLTDEYRSIVYERIVEMCKQLPDSWPAMRAVIKEEIKDVASVPRLAEELRSYLEEIGG